VARFLSAVIALEIGDVRRFGEAKYLVSYAGLVPSARESAERKRQGRCPRDCNVYLKWALVESRQPDREQAKDMAGAPCRAALPARENKTPRCTARQAMAVARHLAEASYWILTKQEVYREPKSKRKFFRRRTGKRELTHGLRG